MRQKKGYTIIGVLGILIAIGLVVGVSIIVINRNRENQQVVEKREESAINRREQNRVERDISNNVDNGLLPDIEIPKVESKIVDNIEPIVNRRYIPRFRSLVNSNNRLAVNKPSIPNIPSIPSIPEQPSIPSIPNTPEIPVTPDIPTPPTPPTPPEPPLPPVLGAGELDKTFDTGVPYNGFNGVVSDILLQGDGKLIVGGDFSDYNGVTVSRGIVRLNPDGSIDTTFDTGTGFNSDVYALIQQADGKILVGGYFTWYNGEQVNKIIRLNEDGSLDNTFDTGIGLSIPCNWNPSFNCAVVNTIAIQGDAKVMVGGSFSQYNGETVNYIARLNEDGSLDTSFDTGTGFNNSVLTLIQQADGKIIVGGYFDEYNGETVNRIARLNEDGSLDTSFDTGTGFNGGVYTLTQQSDGKILVGGYFTWYNGEQVNKIIRLNEDGSLDNTFDTGIGFNNGVLTLIQQADGKIVVGGSFNEYNGEESNYIIRLNPDGTRDNTFYTGTGFNYVVNTITIQQSDGKILVGGLFNEYNGEVANYIARLNADGSMDDTFDAGTGFNNGVETLAVQSDGKIIVGGYFNEYNGETVNRIARLNEDGSLDNTFDTGTSFNYEDAEIYTISIQSDGKIIVGGYYLDGYENGDGNGLARLNTDGSRDTSFTTFQENEYSEIYDLEIQNDGKILVGGYFYDGYQGQPAAYLIRVGK